jgi:hypothetical protein
VFTARRIQRPVVLCALACGLLASMSAATAGATPSKRTADITAAELAGRLAHERTADITSAELAGLALAGSRATASPPARPSEQAKQVLTSRNHGAPTHVEPASAPRVRSADTGFDWGSASIGAAVTGGLVLATAGLGTAYRARIRLAR